MRWLRTLRGQFVTVIAAGVILSSIAVIVILETAREGEIRRVSTAAISDRVGASFQLIADLAPAQRDSAVRAMRSPFFTYVILPEDPLANYTMNAEEVRIAAAVKSAQDSQVLGAVRVRLPPDANVAPDRNDNDRDNNRNNRGDNNRRDNIAGNGNGPGDGGDRRNAPRVNVRGDDRIEVSQSVGPGGWLSVRFAPPPAPQQAPDMLIAAGLAALLTSAAAAWLAGRVSRPLSALAAAADEVARGNTAPTLEPKGPDDLRVAAVAFNAMSDRVTRTLESHRQLLSAVGHDLRTPLSAMRITAEFVDDPEVRDRLTRNLDELQSLTEAVLSAVRSGRGEEMRRVDLGALIESVCDDLVDLGQAVDVEIAGPAPCVCRPSEIRRAVRNLVENAVRYAGAAHVALKSEGDSFVAVVDDSGPGIPEDKLEKVFEPFVRLEESRSNSTGGSGLGLTLARAIAREHGGDVILQNRRGGGVRASLRIPRDGHAARKPTPGVADRAART